MMAARVADNRGLVVIADVQHPVLSLRHTGYQSREPGIELDPQLVGLAGYLWISPALGLFPLPLRGQAAVQHRHLTVRLEAVMGFGLRTVTLEIHRQTRQFVPGSLVTLEVDTIDGLGRQRIYARRGAAGQYQADKKNDQEPLHYFFLPWAKS